MLLRRIHRRWLRPFPSRMARYPIWVPAPRKVIEPWAAGVCAEGSEKSATVPRLAAPPVFICGTARSGTTWAFDIFKRHPRVRAICESWILCQTHGVTAILTQPYWDLDTKAAWQERVDVPFGAVQLLPYEQVVRDVRELVTKWMTQSMLEDQCYLVAKEPLDVRAAAILFPEARFIHVIRDGRNVALSMKRASESWDASMGVGLPMAVRAEGWRRQVANVRSHRASLGDRYLEVRYESMRSDPVAAIRSMFDFAGIAYEQALPESISHSTELSSYGDTALQSGFRGGGREGGWRQDFTVRDSLGFCHYAGDLLIELGYEKDTRWWLAQLPVARRLWPRLNASKLGAHQLAARDRQP